MRYTTNAAEHWLICCDLGKWKVGVTVSHVKNRVGKIVAADTVKLDFQWSPSRMAEMVRRWVRERIPPDAIIELVCEWPQTYAKRRVPHGNIKELQQVGNAIAKALGQRWRKKLRPSAWKGNVPKPAYWARVKPAITGEEWLAWQVDLAPQGRNIAWYDQSAAHDARDAIGITLFALGRVPRGG